MNVELLSVCSFSKMSPLLSLLFTFTVVLSLTTAPLLSKRSESELLTCFPCTRQLRRRSARASCQLLSSRFSLFSLGILIDALHVTAAEDEECSPRRERFVVKVNNCGHVWC